MLSGLNIKSLNNQLQECMLIDVQHFRRRLQTLEKVDDESKRQQLSKDIEQSIAIANRPYHRNRRWIKIRVQHANR